MCRARRRDLLKADTPEPRLWAGAKHRKAKRSHRSWGWQAWNGRAWVGIPLRTPYCTLREGALPTFSYL